MPERPLITARGIVVEEIQENLYRVEMANGYRTFGFTRKFDPPSPEGAAAGCEVTVEYSPYDMSRCHITAWHAPAAPSC